MSMWAQVERLGFQRGALLDALRGRHQTKAAVAYYLLLDSRRRSMGSGAYLRAELSSACEALMQNPLGARAPLRCLEHVELGGMLSLWITGVPVQCPTSAHALQRAPGRMLVRTTHRALVC